MTELPHDPPRGSDIRTHADALRAFFARKTPRTIATVAAGAWTARLLLGPPGVRDVAAVATALSIWPLQEWLMHKHLLHLEPRTVFGLRIDPAFARAHRRHHEEPRDIATTLLPSEVVLFATPVAAGLWLAAFGPSRAAVTGMAAYSTMALFYEWTHFIVHTSVKPKTAYGERVRRNHRLHHFRHEGYWFGFTLPLVDRLFGTDPDPKSVPRSATAMDLHGLRAAEAGAPA